jgi:hypothetical protein
MRAGTLKLTDLGTPTRLTLLRYEAAKREHEALHGEKSMRDRFTPDSLKHALLSAAQLFNVEQEQQRREQLERICQSIAAGLQREACAMSYVVSAEAVRLAIQRESIRHFIIPPETIKSMALAQEAFTQTIAGLVAAARREIAAQDLLTIKSHSIN